MEKKTSANLWGSKRRSTTTTTTDDVVDDETLTPVLPEQLIMEEILARLPVKSLLRFKSVSKFWLFTISHNPHFVKLHLKFSSSLRPQFFMMKFSKDFFGMTDTCFLLPYQECSDATDLVGLGNQIAFHQEHYNFVDSCNGLVCLYNLLIHNKLSYCYFTVWNPATRQYRDIHSPPGIYRALAYGFGYVSSIDDYKIVASFATGEVKKHGFRGFHVFSMRENNWRRIVANSDELTKMLRFRGVLIDDTLYWPNTFRTSYIFGLNLVTEELKEYYVKNMQSGYAWIKLYRLQGSLAMCNWILSGNYDIWILKNLKDWSSWQKLFTVEHKRVNLVTLSETGKCLVRHSQQFKLVDLSKEALEAMDEYDWIVSATDHVESLVSPLAMSNA